MQKPRHSTPLKTANVRSMLMIHQGALGDFILALPILETLRNAFRQAKSVIMGFPRILELVEKRFYADEILAIDQRGMASFFVRGGPLDRNLSQFFSTFNLLVVFGKDEEGILIGNLRQVCRGHILHLNPFPEWTQRIHVSDHLLKELHRYGFPISNQNPRIYLTEKDRDLGRRFFKAQGLTEEERSKAIIVHPGSGSRKKVWPLERFLDLVRYLQRHSDSRILIVLGPAEGTEVQGAFEGIAWDMGPAAPILAKGFSLLGLASVMEGCRLFIGNDSGITHMAAALGLPTVALFGPTDHKIWAPRGEKVIVVRKEISCSPCSQERFVQCQDLECLRGIEVKDVLKGLTTLGFRFGPERARKP